MVTIAADAALRLARYKRRAHFSELAERRAGATASSWRRFYETVDDEPLLAKLDDFPDALLIAGCDWAAVTAVTHLFKRLPEFAESSWSHHNELDGAVLLAGLREHHAPSRHCFQTTFVGERYREYLAHGHFKLIWIVREPRAAVHSALSNRDRACAPWPARGRAGRGAVSRLEKACAAYVGNLRQMLELKERLRKRIAVVDYDELAADRNRLLPALCRFASVSCDKSLLRHLHGKSVRKGALASFEAAIVDELALPAYWRAGRTETLSVAHG